MLFFPSAESHRELLKLLASAQSSLCVCVFTITDDAIARALVERHKHGVRVRVVSDDAQAWCKGADVFELSERGIECLVDDEIAVWRGGREVSVERHMHHKYCVLDNRLLLTGSYNWTSAASTRNCENVLVTDDVRAVRGYVAEFERLWEEFRPQNQVSDNQAAVRIQKVHRSRLGRTRTTQGLSASGRLPQGQWQQRPARRKTLAIAPAAEGALRLGVGELLRQTAAGAEPGACVHPFGQQLARLKPRPGEAAWLCDVAAEEAGNVLTELAQAAEDGTAATDRVLRALNAMVAAVETALLQPPTVCVALFWGERGVSER